MKPKDKKDQILCEAFQNESQQNHTIEREVRENRRIWKKQRSKYLRNAGKKKLRDTEDNE